MSNEQYLVEISYYPGSRRVQEECWYKMGRPGFPSRPNGPAVTKFGMYNPNKHYESEFEVVEYRWHDVDPIYRDPSLPNCVIHDLKTGKVLNTSWLVRNDLMRSFEIGPAQIEYDLNTGNPVFEQWTDYYDGDCPTNELYRRFDPVTGVCFYEYWLKNDRRHRAGGKPAVVLRDPITGIPFKEEWWIDGKPSPHGIQVRDRHPKDGMVLNAEFADVSSEVALPDVTDREAALEAQIAMMRGLRLKWNEFETKSRHLAFHR